MHGTWRLQTCTSVHMAKEWGKTREKRRQYADMMTNLGRKLGATYPQGAV